MYLAITCNYDHLKTHFWFVTTIAHDVFDYEGDDKISIGCVYHIS